MQDEAHVAAIWDFYQVLKDWSTAVCWNTYKAGSSWATAGGMGAGDVNAVAIGSSASIPENTAVDTEIQTTLDPAIIQGMWNGTYNNYGIMGKARAEDDLGDRWVVYSNDHATTGYRPKLALVTHQGFFPRAVRIRKSY